MHLDAPVSNTRELAQHNVVCLNLPDQSDVHLYYSKYIILNGLNPHFYADGKLRSESQSDYGNIIIIWETDNGIVCIYYRPPIESFRLTGKREKQSKGNGDAKCDEAFPQFFL